MPPSTALIHAAVGDRRRAPATWKEWLQARDLRRLTDGELLLLPLVYRNLIACGVPEPDIPSIVKQMYRSTWIRNHLLFRELAALLDVLKRHEIDPLLLKGAALVVGYYRDLGVRPMSDFDLLVHPGQASQVSSLLDRAGWCADSLPNEKSLVLNHASLFRKGEWQCDLHWRMLCESHDANLDERCFEKAQLAKLEDTPVRILPPESQLIQTIVHGTRGYETEARRWIVDSLVLLSVRKDALNWSDLITETQARRLEFPVGEALEYLSGEFGASVPADVISALTSRPVSRLQRWTYCPKLGGARHPQVAEYLFIVSLASRHAKGPFKRLQWIIRYLQQIWKVPKLSLMPWEIVRRGFRRVARSV